MRILMFGILYMMINVGKFVAFAALMMGGE